MTLRILDLFSGAGGSAFGLHQAFPDAEIVGVDIMPQPRYPFRHVVVDAMQFPLEGYDFVWASPPCQGYSIMHNLPWLRDREYPMLVEPIRARLKAWGGLYVIENVAGAQRKAHMAANWLCGGMFGRRFYRHRLFETNFSWWMPTHPRHRHVIRHGAMLGDRASKHGLGIWQERHPGVADGHARGWRVAAAEMEIDWMTRWELTQAIPPVYSRYLAQFIPLAGGDTQRDRADPTSIGADNPTRAETHTEER